MKRLVAVALLSLVVAAGSPVPGADAELAPGTWLSIKGEFRGRIFEAQEVEVLAERSLSVKGHLDGLSDAGGELQFGPLRFALDDHTRLRDIDGSDISPARLESGQRVKVSLSENDDGTLRVRRVRLLNASPSSRLRIEGAVESILPRSGNIVFTMLGVEVRTLARTSWEGIARPRADVDDEDVRPGRGLQLGRFGRLSGELRVDYKTESNFDLFDDFDNDVEAGRVRGRLEWMIASTPRFDAMVQLKAEEEEEFSDENDEFEPESGLTLGRAYVLLHGIVGGHGSLQIGRSKFDDRRDWLYNRDIDALRMFFEFKRWHLEASASEELVDPTRRHEQTFNTHLLVEFYPARRHALAAYVFDRDDSGLRNDGRPRDFSPRLFGLRAEGRKKHAWSYWLEAVRARGSVDGEPLRGDAVDAGVTLVAPWRWEPSLTLGYAYGSGDDDPADGVDRTFRQSGLQLNNGKWNGVASFRYYGELLRPELANLHVETYGLGLRPLRQTSIDLIYHRYQLDEPASEMVDSEVDDRRLNLIDTFIGEELDLVVGFEELKHFDFELDIGYFEPGDAFLGPVDPAITGRLKVKYIF